MPSLSPRAVIKLSVVLKLLLISVIRPLIALPISLKDLPKTPSLVLNESISLLNVWNIRL
jgi:hypothetical protein